MELSGCFVSERLINDGILAVNTRIGQPKRIVCSKADRLGSRLSKCVNIGGVAVTCTIAMGDANVLRSPAREMSLPRGGLINSQFGCRRLSYQFTWPNHMDVLLF